MTEKRFENRLDKSNVKFNTLNPTWDNEKETGLNVFEMIDELNKLSDENKQIKHIIKEAYETERTAIGKSVLKQLMEAIE